jgi:pimeloyl-ACP methyl ester carboxylesterase
MVIMESVTSQRRYARGPVGRLAYEDVGRGDQAIVLVHGGLADRSHFAAITAHLASRRRVVAMDLRGHGDSDMPGEEFSVADLAQDIAAVCDAAGVEHAVICGHSLSGGVALELAATRPDLVSAVAILDGAILYAEPVLQALRGELLPALNGPGWRDALRGLVVSRMLTPYDPSELRDRVLSALADTPEHVAVPWFRNAYEWDARERIADGRHPLLFVHATSPVDLERLRQLRPDVLLGRVVGSGHFLTLAVPDQVNAMLDRFLDICTASRADRN